MTPAHFEQQIIELCKTNSRELLWDRGLELIRDSLGENAHNYLKGLDLWLNRVKQLGMPVTPVPYQGAQKAGGAL